jgi:hypothetical protein
MVAIARHINKLSGVFLLSARSQIFKALGLDVSLQMQQRADEVIE